MQDISQKISEKEEMVIRSTLESAMAGWLGEGPGEHNIVISSPKPDYGYLVKKAVGAIGYAHDYTRAFINKNNGLDPDDVRYNLAEMRATEHREWLKNAAKRIFRQYNRQ